MSQPRALDSAGCSAGPWATRWLGALGAEIMAWVRNWRFWITQARGNRRPVTAGFRLEGCLVWEAGSLPRWG
jgi:hypothetical protein